MSCFKMTRWAFWSFFLCGLSLSLEAAELRTDSSLNSSVRYSDNLRLSDTNKESITGVTLQPKVSFQALNENWNTNIDAKLRSTRYSSNASLDNNSVFINAGSVYNTELSQYQLTANLDKNTSLDRGIDSTLKDAGIDEQQWTRKTQNIRASWQYQFTEDRYMNVAITHTAVDYQGDAPINFTGNKVDSFELSHSWITAERSRIELSSSLSQFENELKTFEYKQWVYQLAYIYSWDQTTEINLSIGKRVLDSVFHDQLIACDFISPIDGTCLLNPVLGSIATNNEGNVVNFSFSSRGERSQYSINASRTVIPSSVGGASQQDSIAGNYSYSFSSIFSANLRATATNTLTIEGLDNSRDAERRVVNVALSYRLNKDMKLSLSYQKLNYVQLIDNIDRISNAITLNLYTAWPRLMSTY